LSEWYSIHTSSPTGFDPYLPDTHDVKRKNLVYNLKIAIG